MIATLQSVEEATNDTTLRTLGHRKQTYRRVPPAASICGLGICYQAQKGNESVPVLLFVDCGNAVARSHVSVVLVAIAGSFGSLCTS